MYILPDLIYKFTDFRIILFVTLWLNGGLNHGWCIFSWRSIHFRRIRLYVFSVVYVIPSVVCAFLYVGLIWDYELYTLLWLLVPSLFCHIRTGKQYFRNILVHIKIKYHFCQIHFSNSDSILFYFFYWACFQLFLKLHNLYYPN